MARRQLRAYHGTATNNRDSSVPTSIMKHTAQPQAIQDDMARLVEDARALVAATADVAGEGVSEARQRLAATLDDGRNIIGRVKAKTIEGAQATNQAVHLHPYQAMGIAFGLGALVGVLGELLARRCCHKGN
jgi:ElaB/YqjD/DUF883 family membrane-anchored ribosome-binding protein